MFTRSSWSVSKRVLAASLFSYAGSLAACGSDAAESAASQQGMAASANPMAAASSTTGEASAAPSKTMGASMGPAGTGAAPATMPTSASHAQSTTTAGTAAAATAGTTAMGSAGTAAAADDAGAPNGEIMPGDTSTEAAGDAAAGSTSSAAPTAGMAGSLAAAGSGGAESAPAHEDLGQGDGSDVITIGDSWMSNTLGTGDAIQGAMQRLNMQPYRHYAVQGVMLMSASAFGPAIPSQYDTAKRINPDIKTVLMTGGGNDIIQNPAVQASCNEGGQECLDLLNNISDTLNELWTQMAADGVQDVVYVQYSKDAGTTSDKVRGMQKPIEICSSGKIRCHAIDSTEAVMAELQDGIHPTRAANDRLAKVIWDLMEKEGIRR